ncbi:MAG: hypothetical protein ACAH59_07510 [Pseudobdellovibrionaceae bacterium]
MSNQKGFALVFLLALLPLLISGILAILFSQYLTKNWMQSLHICRTELLKTQKTTASHLRTLMNLNTSAKALRLALQRAQIQLAIAIATKNFPLAAKAKMEILRIEKLRRQLDGAQRSLILQANFEMSRGVQTVLRKIKKQSQDLQAHLPPHFNFQIQTLTPQIPVLAVQPDRPETAPAYELKAEFEQQQALHVSWISQFQTGHKDQGQWIQNKHKKKDSCSATIQRKGQSFTEILHADRFSWKL